MTYTYLNEVMYIDYSTLDRNLDFIKKITYQKSYLLLYLKYLSISNINQKWESKFYGTILENMSISKWFLTNFYSSQYLN